MLKCTTFQYIKDKRHGSKNVGMSGSNMIVERGNCCYASSGVIVAL